MRIRNTSQYPDEEVKRLVEFGFHGVADAGVVVNVKNSKRGYRGRAYHGIPSESPVANLRTACRLVTIGIGEPSQFPMNNMDTVRRWQKVSEEEYVSLPIEEQRKLEHTGWYENNVLVRHSYRREIVTHHPYGGKSSPLMVYANWQEALVAVAAHEARHIWQMANHKPLSEVNAEKFADKALARFRAGPAAATIRYDAARAERHAHMPGFPREEIA